MSEQHPRMCSCTNCQPRHVFTTAAMTPETLDALRKLLVSADSMLSLLWHRHVPAERRDLVLTTDVQRTIQQLRDAYEKPDGLLTALRTSSASTVLFESGAYVLHSGEASVWKINCDVLTDGDWFTLAHLIRMRVGRFSAVEGVPTGGERLARALQPLAATDGPLLIVDDVLTTGASMEQQRAGREAVGVVVFARDECPAWVTPLFSMLRTSSASPSDIEKIRARLQKVFDDPNERYDNTCAEALALCDSLMAGWQPHDLCDQCGAHKANCECPAAPLLHGRPQE